jgi:hypothetical protein
MLAASAMMESPGPETQAIAVLEVAMWVMMAPPGRKAHISGFRVVYNWRRERG